MAKPEPPPITIFGSIYSSKASLIGRVPMMPRLRPTSLADTPNALTLKMFNPAKGARANDSTSPKSNPW